MPLHLKKISTYIGTIFCLKETTFSVFIPKDPTPKLPLTIYCPLTKSPPKFIRYMAVQ